MHHTTMSASKTVWTTKTKAGIKLVNECWQIADDGGQHRIMAETHVSYSSARPWNLTHGDCCLESNPCMDQCRLHRSVVVCSYLVAPVTGRAERHSGSFAACASADHYNTIKHPLAIVQSAAAERCTNRQPSTSKDTPYCRHLALLHVCNLQ